MAKAGDIRKVGWIVKASEIGESTATLSAVSAFLSAAQVHIRNQAASELTALLGSPVLGVALFVASFLSAAFDSLTHRLGKQGVRVIFTMECVDIVETQGGQEFHILKWKPIDVEVEWWP